MSRKFDKYRVRDGVTRLNAAFFNSVFSDVDLRLHAQEQIDADWRAQIKKLNDEGLKRLDQSIAPAIQSVQNLASLGFLHAHVALNSAVVWSTGAQAISLDVSTTEAQSRVSHFEPSPFVVLTRASTPNDYLVARRDNFTLTHDAAGNLTAAVLSLTVLRATGAPSGGQASDVWVYASPGAMEAIAGFVQDAQSARDTTVADTAVATMARDTAIAARDVATAARQTASASATAAGTSATNAAQSAQAAETAALSVTIKSNYNATRDPTPNDDTTAGYSPGSTWVSSASNEIFRAVSVTAGAAQWVKTTLTLADLGTAAAHAATDFATATQGALADTALQRDEITHDATNVTPAAAATGIVRVPTLKGSAYYPLYGVPQRARHFQLIAQGGNFATPLYSASEAAPATDHVMGTALSSSSSYLWRYRDETATGEFGHWSAPTAFTTGNMGIATPTITNPANNATNVGEQPVIQISAFAVTGGGSDTQSATSVRIKDSTGTIVWSVTQSTSPLDNFTVPKGILQPGQTTYTVEAQQFGATYGASPWSAPATFVTATSFRPNFETQIGTPYGGGYVAGKIVSDYDGLTYGIIVSDGGGDTGQTAKGTLDWRTANTAVSSTAGTPPMTLADGVANMQAMITAGLAEFPAAQWIQNTLNAGTGLNGYTDWYLPARDELEILYRHFKPTTTANNTSTRPSNTYFGADGQPYGTNSSSVPAGAAYTGTTPAQTGVTDFLTGNPASFAAAYYWSSTEYSGSYAWLQGFGSGGQTYYTKTYAYQVRAVRRIPL